MKKFLKALMILVMFMTVAVTAVAIWKGDTIIAAVNALQYKDYSAEEINQKIQENDQKLQEEIAAYTGGVPLRDITPEEQAQIDRGETTYEEVVNKILNGEDSGGSAQQTQAPEESGGGDEDTVEVTAPVSPAKEITNRYIAKMYALKSKYVGQLDACIAQAISEYKALPREQHTSASKRSIMSKYLGQFAGLESACDAEVNGVLSALESELKEIGADTGIVQTIRNAYANEKSMKMAYYMNTYG